MQSQSCLALTAYERRGNGLGCFTISGADASLSSLKGDWEKVQSNLARKVQSFAEFKRLGKITAPDCHRVPAVSNKDSSFICE